jgi:hydrogenase maturation protein HypF
MPLSGRHIEIRGVVQGVGFRPFVYVTARRDGVTGRVRNDSTGVIIDAFGTDEALSAFIVDLTAEAPPAARIRKIDWDPIPFEPVAGFDIVASGASEERNVSIPPDLAICDDCLREVFDPSDRRYLYPFTNCTNCGPRYSIVRDIPYDRAKTTMAPFFMCPECQAEYEDPANRRFHAQPNACRSCGPRISIVTPDGREVATESAMRFAARALRAQLIVAVKGIGGFHLACDARSSIAVQRLRDRKHRDAKPLAVMVRDLEAAEAVAELTEADRALLTSVERPVVLVRRRSDAAIATEVAGPNPLLGLFLPYTPLHHILIREAAMPLVMTSANLSDEPMVSSNRDALAQLHDVADLFLVHDRHIETRVDDSVARIIGGAPVLLRRARGYVPRGVELQTAFAEPILGCGAQLKNAICIGSGHSAFLGPHVGDLETAATFTEFEKSIAQMKRFIGVDPIVVAHDMHPDYLSTRWALSQQNVRLVAVQHHHAHIVSAMAEYGLRGPVLGFAYDGTGYGTDGTSWGGEVMVADEIGFERVATFREIPLAGGDQAIRHVWRIALALLDEAFEGAPPLDSLPLFRDLPPMAIDSVRQMIDKRVNTPLARGVGRYFDALGAIGLSMADSRYEGEVAFLWNMAADPGERGRYPVVIREGARPWTVDMRPLVRSAVIDLLEGRSPATVSARFHNTVAEVTMELARTELAARGDMPVVLSGGCFQNARLAESVLKGLSGTNRIFMNRDVPPGDGGIALGQTAIANALVSAGLINPLPAISEVPTCV